MTSLSRISPPFAPGTVWLVGAGPGDPGLLTIHAINALAKADVIVYDALVDPAVLSFAREGAVLEDRKSTRLNSSHANISYAVFCLKKKLPTTSRLPPSHS